MIQEKLEEAKRLYQTANADQRYVLESLFPELAESEDEKIRKELIQLISCMHDADNRKERWIAWLEKQCEQKEYTFKSLPRLLDMIEPTNKAKAYCQKLIDTLVKEGYVTDAKIVSDCLKQMNGEKVAMATMDEKKPIDNIEPKFEIEKGKWYVCNTSRYTDFVVGKAYYCPKNGMLKPNENAIARYVARDCFHPWSIDDAKDSDVLVTYDIRDNMKWIFLYRPNKHKLHINDPRFYCHYDLKSDSFKKDNDYVSVALGTKFRPATKEQCDLLFAKMKEAGYEWDAKKKELRKIEEEYDEEDCGIDGIWVAQSILKKTLGKVEGYQSDDGILEHKCAIAAVKKLYEWKPIWSEEDENFFANICSIIDADRNFTESAKRRCKDWLKSLKQKIGE